MGGGLPRNGWPGLLRIRGRRFVKFYLPLADFDAKLLAADREINGRVCAKYPEHD